jgi:hypothetical protein
LCDALLRLQAQAQLAGAYLAGAASSVPQLAPLLGTCQPCAPGCGACTSAVQCRVCAPGFTMLNLADVKLNFSAFLPPSPPAAPLPPPASVVASLLAAATGAQAGGGNLTVCLRSTPGLGLEGVVESVVCTLLPSETRALFPMCPPLAPPPPAGARVVGNASAPPVVALAGPPGAGAFSSSSTWLAAARAVAAAATPLAQASALAHAYGSVVTVVNFTLRDGSVFGAADALARSADSLLDTAAALLPNASALLTTPALRAAAAAAASQTLQLYISCSPGTAVALAENASQPALNASFWAALPEVKAAAVSYGVARPMGVWDAKGDLSAVTCRLYQARV